ncbi:MAG: pitrilysin family protein, partial [Pseudomonadota bacterium]
LRAFQARLYRAPAIVVSVAGAFDRDEVHRLAEKRFGAVPRETTPAAARGSCVLTGGFRHIDKPLEQTHIAFAAPGCGVCDDHYYASRVFTEILGGGMSSRLFQKVREEAGRAYSVYAYLDAYDDIGTTGVYVGADEAHAADALSMCLQEIAALAQSVRSDELARAKALLRSSLLMGLESPLARAERSAGQLFSFGRLIDPEETLSALEGVSTRDIEDAAQRALVGAMSLAVVGPAPFDRLEAAVQAFGRDHGLA